MANRTLSPYRVYKFIMTANANQYIINNYSSGQSWKFQDGILWTDRDEPEYKLSDFKYEHTGTSANVIYTNSNYVLDADGTPFFVNNTTTTWGLLSGDLYFDFVPKYISGGNAPLVPDSLYDLSMSAYEIKQRPAPIGISSIAWTFTHLADYDDTDPLHPYLSFLIYPDSNHKFISANIHVLVEYTDSEIGGTHIIDVNEDDYPTFINATVMALGHIQGYVSLNGLQDILNDYCDVYGIISVGINVDNALIKKVANITLDGSNVTFSNTASSVNTLTAYSNTITANSGYYIKNVTVLMGGTDITSSVYNPSTHIVSILSSNVINDFIIIVDAEKKVNVNFYSSDGLSQLYNGYFEQNVEIKVVLSGTTRKYYINNSLVQSYSGAIPSGYHFAGLSFSANQTSPSVMIGQPYRTTISDVINFYEVIAPDISPTNTFELNVYTNNSSEDVLDKDLTYIGNITGALREECSVLHPIVKIEVSDVLYFNYVYIPIFKRYYYVESTKVIRTNLWEITLKVDVLKTYKDLILSQNAYVLRNENYYDDDKVDSYVSMAYEKEITYEEITPDTDVFYVNENISYPIIYLLTTVDGYTPQLAEAQL